MESTRTKTRTRYFEVSGDEALVFVLTSEPVRSVVVGSEAVLSAAASVTPSSFAMACLARFVRSSSVISCMFSRSCAAHRHKLVRALTRTNSRVRKTNLVLHDQRHCSMQFGHHCLLLHAVLSHKFTHPTK
jgi:hypothetical protein